MSPKPQNFTKLDMCNFLSNNSGGGVRDEVREMKEEGCRWWGEEAEMRYGG